MQLEFVPILATDKVELPGLLYQPQVPSKIVAIWLHGMGDNGVFYKPERINRLAEALTAKGIALLAFNNRGAHDKKRLHIADESLSRAEQRYPGGTHYELIADCMRDIDGAVAFLRAQGYQKFYLVGHSSGANKICVYDHFAKNNPFSKYVLAGAGDDTGIFYDQLGPSKFKTALDYAREALAHDRPLVVMPQYTGMFPFSAQSAEDILNPDGDYNTFPMYEAARQRLGSKPLFRYYRAIQKPMLVIYGALDDSVYTAGGPEMALKILKKHTNPDVLTTSKFTILDESDHSFHEHESEFSEEVASWLSQ